jgi:acyl-CoA synthetase (AMP-forming)/AMP-acid ligase II
MEVTITDLWVPGKILPKGQAGRICITDLMNLHTCAFLRTDDLGRRLPGGKFEVLGRVDNAELRGCNLMVE